MADHRVVLVTGGNDGIGLEIVKYLAAQGHFVWLGSRDSAKGDAAAAKVREELGKDNVQAVQINVVDDNSVLAAFKTIEEKSGKLDSLVNNAGSGRLDKFPQQAASIVDFDVLRDCFEAALSLLGKSSHPVILFVTSDMASTTTQATGGHYHQVTAYNTSKAATASYAVSLSKEFPHFKVNVVSPGFTSTKLNGYAQGGASAADSGAFLGKFAELGEDGPNCKFFARSGELPF